jgi:hypothetical protein
MKSFAQFTLRASPEQDGILGTFFNKRGFA